MRAIILPTSTAKAKVFSIHTLDTKVIKRVYICSTEDKKAKSFKIKIPKIIPPNKDKSTFLEYSAIAIASKDGKSERGESSMTICL